MKLQIQIFIFYTVIFYLSVCFTEATFNIANMDYGVRNGISILWIIVVVIQLIIYAINKLDSQNDDE